MLTGYSKQLNNKYNMITRKKIKVIILSVFFFLFSSGLVLAASGPIVPYSDPSHSQHEIYNSGSYSLNDVLLIGVQVSNIILGIVGSLALLMFIYGGFMFLISSGNSEKV